MRYDIDPSTGLPALPEGQRWHISRTQFAGYERVTVTLEGLVSKYSSEWADYETRRWGQRWTEVPGSGWRDVWGETLGYGHYFPDDDTTPDVLRESVLYAAETILDQRAVKQAIAELVGTYPPKRLPEVDND